MTAYCTESSGQTTTSDDDKHFAVPSKVLIRRRPNSLLVRITSSRDETGAFTAFDAALKAR